jgi:hypothetical protein
VSAPNWLRLDAASDRMAVAQGLAAKLTQPHGSLETICNPFPSLGNPSKQRPSSHLQQAFDLLVQINFTVQELFWCVRVLEPQLQVLFELRDG